MLDKWQKDWLISAKEVGTSIRNHWYIENKVNYVKDVAFQEDKTVKRVNPFIFSTCISFAMNILRNSGINDLKKATHETSLDIFKFLEAKNLFILASTP